ncbi:MAG: hypothetical protein LBH95_00335 [Oscillospiraceae bacterium]|nr:hypothetical protein [Oscillospiraceae bacterium]
MSKKAKSMIAYTGIGCILLYFIVVAGYFLTESRLMLKCWEAMIILSAPVMLLVIVSVLEHAGKDKTGFKTAALAFMTCAAAITAAVHYGNVISFEEITAELQTNDSLAWGFFVGLAFLFTAAALPPEIVKLRRIKYTAAVCGCLCLLGLSGPVTGAEALWFISVVGYGLGTPVICLQLLSFYKS